MVQKNKDRVRKYIKEKYSNDFDFQKNTGYQRERYRTSRSNAVKLKPGRKPRSSSNSGDESISPPPIARCEGRPRIKGILENKNKKPPGRPIQTKHFTSSTPSL